MSEARTEDRYLWLQRLLEMVPGTVSWAVIIGPIWLSFSYPELVAYFVLSFDFYWLCRAVWFSGAVIVAYRRIRGVLRTDWQARLDALDDSSLPDWRSYTHLALIPTYTEPLETLRQTVKALAGAQWPAERKICAIITRETDAAGIANVGILRDEFGAAFADFLHILDPLEPGIVVGKSSAMAWGGKHLYRYLVREKGMDPRRILVDVGGRDRTAGAHEGRAVQGPRGGHHLPAGGRAAFRDGLPGVRHGRGAAQRAALHAHHRRRPAREPSPRRDHHPRGAELSRITEVLSAKC